MLKIPLSLLPSSFFFALPLTLIGFHGSSVLFDNHVFFHLSRPLAFLSHLLFSLSPLFSRQTLQGMLSSLHSELDIQRYLMKIQLPHRVSQPFILSASHCCVCQCVCGYVRTLANICCVTHSHPTSVPPCLSASALTAPASLPWLSG